MVNFDVCGGQTSGDVFGEQTSGRFLAAFDQYNVAKLVQWYFILSLKYALGFFLYLKVPL